MRRVKLDQLTEGMVVAENVLGKNAELLIPRGAEITLNTIRLLETWEVISVAIEGAAEEESFPPEMLEAENKEMRLRFSGDIDKNPLVLEIIKTAVIRRIRAKLPPPPPPPPPAEKTEESTETSTEAASPASTDNASTTNNA